MADAMGTRQVVEKLERLRQRFGDRFEPAPLLLEKARSGGTFY
jgi:3-hydroxyacyl-CoA dehydrogenase/enoyl-CoA hydratase/3-hydroxybutyryl-CoA epimerase